MSRKMKSASRMCRPDNQIGSAGQDVGQARTDERPLLQLRNMLVMA